MTDHAPTLSLRPYQGRIVEQVVDALAGPDDLHSVLVESPTGSGKTVMGLAAAAELARRGTIKSVAWIAMRRTLLAQAVAENKRWNFGLDLRPVSMFDADPPRCDLAIIDEAQHDAALSMANLYGKMKAKKLIGLSATPFRSDRFRLCFQKSIRDAGIHRLIADGYLSEYEHFTLESWDPAGVAGAYLREADRWGQSLIFFRTRVECEACLSALEKGGVAAEVVTADSDRERQIADFEAGALQVLVNMSVLGEGFDCPSLRDGLVSPRGQAADGADGRAGAAGVRGRGVQAGRPARRHSPPVRQDRRPAAAVALAAGRVDRHRDERPRGGDGRADAKARGRLPVALAGLPAKAGRGRADVGRRAGSASGGDSALATGRTEPKLRRHLTKDGIMPEAPATIEIDARHLPRFEYRVVPLTDFSVSVQKPERPTTAGGAAAKGTTLVRLGGEPLLPTPRFWQSTFKLLGIGEGTFAYFDHAEVFERVVERSAGKGGGRVRVAVERAGEGQASRPPRLAGVSDPKKPYVPFDLACELATRHDGGRLSYADGILTSDHTPRSGMEGFNLGPDSFANRFVFETPVDGVGSPRVFLSLLRTVCTNGMVAYARAFRSDLRVGMEAEATLDRALGHFDHDAGFSALRQRFEMAQKSWASVAEVLKLERVLRRCGSHLTCGVPRAIERVRLAGGDLHSLYGLANLDGLSARRQRLLPAKCRAYDLLNVASEIATHHADATARRLLDGYVGDLVADEFDLEGTAEKVGDFRDLFVSLN